MAGKIDNSDLRQKVALRNRLFNYPVSTKKCLELFSGTGEIRTAFWDKAVESVYSVDIENKGCHLDLISDSFSLAYLSPNFEIIDCDAYGVVLPLIKEMAMLRNSRQLYFFTDGGEVQNKHRGKNYYSVKKMIEEMNPTDYLIEYSRFASRVVYGLIYFENV